MMGLLNSVNKLVSNIGSSKVGQKVFKPGGVVDTITKPIQAVAVVTTKPITTLTKGYTEAKKQVTEQSLTKSIGQTLLNTGAVAAAVLTGGTSAGRSAAVKVAKALIPTTPKGVITAAVVAPIAAGVISKTTKPLEAITKAPGTLAAFGQDVGTFIDEPTLRNAEAILKENPGVSIALGGGAALLGAGSIISGIGAIENIKTREAVNDLTDTLSAGNSLPPVSANTNTLPADKVIPSSNQIAPTTAITPATTNLTKSSSGVRRRKRKSTRSPSVINQRVNVLVSNNNTTKRYLNRRAINV